MKSPFDIRRKLVRTKYEHKTPFYWAYFSWQRMEAFLHEAAEALDWRTR